ncbi:MAG: hypothetical protein SFW36_01050 [Leptolyngbyaceae cyanobacterium bins.59]|nr:hypothetical protein [Leptolyngbyaceae cyanobacterium bins.59]
MEEYQQVLGPQGANEFIKSLKQLEDYYEGYVHKLTALKDLFESRLGLIQQLQNLPTLVGSNDVEQILHVLSEAAIPSPLFTAATNTLELAEAKEPVSKKTRTPRKTKPKEDLPLPSETSDISDSDASDGKETNLTQLRLQSFRDMSLLDAIATILDRHPGQPMQTQELIEQVYGKRVSKESFKRIKLLMNSTLSRGKKANRWQNVEGRPGYYVAQTS